LIKSATCFDFSAWQIASNGSKIKFGKRMKKIVFAGFLILFLTQLNGFAKQPFNSRDLSRQIKEVNGQITSIRIKVAESMIEELNSSTDPGVILSLKSIHSLAVEYGDFLEYESIVILMYPYIRENFKRYFSSMLRSNIEQKKKKFDWSMESFTRHESNIKNSDINSKLVQLRKRIEEAQILVDQLINYYSSEYDKYKQD
jgi:hypothetical protein